MTLRIGEPRPLQAAPADEVGFLAADEAAEAEGLGCRGAVELGTGDMAFLDAHDAHRLGAVGGDAGILPDRHDPLPDRPSVTGGPVDPIGALAPERAA